MNFSFLKNRKIIIGLWLVVALVAAIKQFVIGKYNNYLIFKHVFFHTIEKKSLYGLYPESYFDHNHYGPIFSVFIAPFAVLPDAVGMPLWAVFNAAVLIML
jgi:beta-lactamase regulating signal transducer with metallopeptidase domain